MKRFFPLYIIIGVVCFLLAACQDADDSTPSGQATTVTLNVDVIMPSSLQSQFQNSIDWALANIQKAQQQCRRKVKLNLRYHDEDREDLGNLVFNLTHPRTPEDTCHAIIGPMSSVHVSEVLPYVQHTDIPVILPTCSSANLQRQLAKTANVWLLTESDITQCETMLTSVRDKVEEGQAALIYSDDSYGESFKDWFGFFTTEFQMEMPGNGVHLYRQGEDLQALFSEWAESSSQSLYICLALSSVDAFQDVLSQLQSFREGEGFCKKNIFPICSDVALDKTLIQRDDDFGGIAPVADPSTGFTTNYLSRFDTFPINGVPQLYDALTLIALGEAKALGSDDLVDRNLNDWMRQAAVSKEGVATNWTDAGLATAFQRYALGEPCKLVGAQGAYTLDALTHTKRLQTSYMFWIPTDGKVNPQGFYSTAGTSGSSSVSGIWEWNHVWQQEFDESISANIPQVPITDRWALLVTPSHLWESYRHQADVFAMYQTLRRHGYDDDHIILISEDNLADSPENSQTPGKMYVEPGGDDVRKNAQVDYHPSNLTVEDVSNILAGNASARLPHVLHTSSTSDIFIYWSGHGNASEGPLWSDVDQEIPFGCKAIRQIVSSLYQQGKFRRMMLAVEACYSGLWGETLKGIPNVMVLTAANMFESSKADIWDTNRQTYLSNGFTRAFRNAIEENPSITLRDLYLKVAQSTTGSHATLYNEKSYGSVYVNGMGDYLP